MLKAEGGLGPNDLRKLLREKEEAHWNQLDELLQNYALDDLKHHEVLRFSGTE